MSDRVHVQPAAREVWDRLGLTDFDSVMAYGSGMTVSRHAQRNTSLITVGQSTDARRLYLKRVHRVPIKHVLEDLLSRRLPRPQPLREWQAIERCKERGIPAMRGLAWGQRSTLGVPRQAFILVEAVPAVECLDEALHRLARPNADARAAADRRRLARELGAFIARVHEAGLAWPDMVGKHIYLAPRARGGRGCRWEFHLIDLERMNGRATHRTQTRDLKRLLTSLRPYPLGPTDLLRFALSYLGRSPAGWRDDRPRLEESFAWARSAVRRSWASRRPRLPMPDDAVPPNRQRLIRHGRVVVNQAFVPILQDNGLVNLASVFRYAEGERLDKANIGSWRQRLRLDLTDFHGKRQTFYLKRYQRPPIREQLRRIVFQRAGRATAWWEWRSIRSLAAAGIPAPTPVAYGEKMRGIFERRSFLLTEAIPGESLERWVPEHLGPGRDVDWQTRRGLVRQLALLVRTLHRRRLVHRDLYLSHVFISHNRDGKAVLHLIDLQRVFRPRWRWRRWQVKDLAALHYSTPIECVPVTERVRFLRHYFGVRKLGPDHRRMIRSIVARARRTERHNRPR